MAGIDYYSCDVCGNKTFYDANVDWDSTVEFRRIGQIACICVECRKTCRISITRNGEEIQPDGGGRYIERLKKEYGQ